MVENNYAMCSVGYTYKPTFNIFLNRTQNQVLAQFLFDFSVIKTIINVLSVIQNIRLRSKFVNLRKLIIKQK